MKNEGAQINTTVFSMMSAFLSISIINFPTLHCSALQYKNNHITTQYFALKAKTQILGLLKKNSGQEFFLPLFAVGHSLVLHIY